MEEQRMDTRIKVAKLLKMRAYIFECSYHTAWSLWMDEEEKQGFTYVEVIPYV